MLIPNRPSWLRLSLTTLAALVLAATLVAQEAATPAPAPAPAAQPKASPSPEKPRRAPKPGDIQKVFIIQRVSPRVLAEVLAAFPATITYSSYGHSDGLGVSAAPAVVAAIEETIKRLDVPETTTKTVQRSAEITAYVIEALAEPVANAKVPAVLDPIVAQFRTTFRYADYRLVDTLIARAVLDSGARFQAEALSEADIWQGRRTSYALEGRPAFIATDTQPVIRMTRLEFRVGIPIPEGDHYNMWHSKIAGDLDIPDGQYVVVGKSGTSQPGNALILVLRAKIVD